MDIKPIDRSTVHRICSGQVVLTLAVAVKELIENSVDAGACSVDVRLQEYGSKTIEVIDNGAGVEEKNFEGLTLKHHTSKIDNFEDLECGVSTFGFRGEALSSLCALSKLTVITRHKETNVATKIEYDHHGRVVGRTPCARQVGTTVILEDLFNTLPVRHKEFLRNLKREFHKMVVLLNAYCIISTKVRITCSNSTSNGKRSVVVSTNGSSSMIENIATVFGSKQLSSLKSFLLLEPSAEHKEQFNVKQAGHQPFTVTGQISSCVHGSGRGSVDRQYYFINGRPCEIEKLSRLINEVYRTFNKHQYPCVFLNIEVDKGAVDVNVTPDKRKIFLDYEPLLLAAVKTSLVALWEPEQSSYTPQNVPKQETTPTQVDNTSSIKRTFAELYAKVKEERGSAAKKRLTLDSFVQRVPKDKVKTEFSPPRSDNTNGFAASTAVDNSPNEGDKDSLDVSLSSENISQCSQNSVRTLTSTDEMLHPESNSFHDLSRVTDDNRPNCSSQKYLPIVETSLSANKNHHSNHHCGSSPPENLQSTSDLGVESETLAHIDIESDMSSVPIDVESDMSSVPIDIESDMSSVAIDIEPDMTSVAIDIESDMSSVPIDIESDMSSVPIDIESDMSSVAIDIESDMSSAHIDIESDMTSVAIDSESQTSSEVIDVATQISLLTNVESQYEENSLTIKDESVVKKRNVVNVEFSFVALKSQLTNHNNSAAADPVECPKFRAEIAPSQNTDAENELKQSIDKTDFSKMEILGQFNHGFIICRHGSDLFIIDQHASDEKYNFEMLQRHTVIKRQTLLVPKPLSLSSANELLLMDNLEAFHKNGFEFEIKADAEPTLRVSLKTQPVSKNWTFGKDDIDEILYMLREAPERFFRPSRVRAMFASRACRKSVMVGKPLGKQDMNRLVRHMGEIEQPWNCPHGRPTMRHLVNLDLLQI